MTQENSKLDYKNTLHLPKTDFPMKADLSRQEPKRIQFWRENQVYSSMIDRTQGRPPFILHDGPPYANGHIHFGHILNKVLKDFIVKYRNIAGFQSEYVPGWDCHGLPIEHQVDKDLGGKKGEMDVLQIRKACREYAQKFVDAQKEEFERLGILARWEAPYLTMNYGYEATILRELARLVKAGSVFRGRKPVHWCMNCKTALAEAEVEYEDRLSPSIYVKFPVKSDLGALSAKLAGKKVSILIWTTTPWTLPANQGIALHKSYMYAALEVNQEVLIVAEGLLEELRKVLNWKDSKLIDRIAAPKFENLLCAHPFLARDSKIVLSNHVTLEQGTGCVHLAPAHGQEDYEVGLHYGLPVSNPVNEQGRFTEEVQIPELVGKKVFEANPFILDLLRIHQALLKEEMVQHSYPHCWRCKKPVIFRSTPQWFISMEKNDLRQQALDAIRRSQWIPAWGRDRIYGMVENRPDWCISRQRSWGVPITAMQCKECKEDLLNPDYMEKIADRFEQEGADAWFGRSIEELLGESPRCPRCSSPELEKQNDILDVWFDSGVSFAAVLEQNPLLQFPADLYLEGSDQHRGWFHSSLLASVGTRKQAPYKTVLTHGFVVDGEGRKYSKSAKNYLPPEEVLKKTGAEILRLWVACEDYRNDIRFSDEILARLTEAYRKIRNTCRYLLGNLYDFRPDVDSLPFEDLLELDRWVLSTFYNLVDRCNRAYLNYEFHRIYQELNEFCILDLSSFYLDVLKDRLYTSGKKSHERKSGQTALFELARGLALWISPILSFTAEEVWQAIPSFTGKAPSVFLNDLCYPPAQWNNEALEERMQQVRWVRNEVQKALEIARQKKLIGSSLEAQVRLTAEGGLLKLLQEYEPHWPSILIVSQVVVAYELEEATHEISEFDGLKILVQRAEGKKCERCWNYSLTVARSKQYPEVCSRCEQVLESERDE